MALKNDGKTIAIDSIISVTETCLIQITDVQLENILNLHVVKLKKSKEWIAALSFFATILLVLLTSDFQDKWGINKDGWFMLFLLIGFISFGYLIYTIYNCFKHNVTVQSIIVDIKSRNQK